MAHQILTAPGGEFELDPQIREMIAYLADGRLLISKSHAFNPHVRAFTSRLQRLGRPANLQQVDMKVIADYYAAANDDNVAKNQATSSRTQTDAMEIFRRAVTRRASDIHIRVSQKQRTQIYFRVLGDIEFIEEHPYDYGLKLCSTIYQTMSDVSDAVFEVRSHQDARIADKTKLPVGLDGIRIATTPQVDGVVMVLRLLYDDTDDAKGLESLGYKKNQEDSVRYMRRRPTGINIIAGPTGSGKSTTLKHILAAIHAETEGRKHIITVEDPPEYTIVGAVQTPVTNAETEAERSKAFLKAIRAALRLDPDVIMIGEIRDAPAAALAIQASMTGHQVWTTVHANNALAIIDRLIDLGISRDLIADPTIVSGLICQRLVQRLCDHCKVPLADVLGNYERDEQDRMMGAISVTNAYVQGSGCPHCDEVGLVGRVAIAETIVTDHTLMNFIRANDKRGAIDYWRRDQGGKSMAEQAIVLVNQGIVDPFKVEEEIGPLTAVRIESDHRVTSEEMRNA